jgi:glyoxylase-like metal-dependent hydrolase (beta-lactamase superfamily II)
LESKMEMLLRVRAVGPWRMNAYALVCPATMQSVLIDPGDEPRALDVLLEGTRPAATLLTPTHPDHIGTLEVMRAQLKPGFDSHRQTD